MEQSEQEKSFFSTNLFVEFVKSPSMALREKLIMNHLNLARFLTKRFINRGVDYEDLFQLAVIGLINSIDRYDPKRNIKFATYATSTIIGEIRRYFRDKGWQLTVPRRIQLVYVQIKKAQDELSQELMRKPTILEIGKRIKASEVEVAEALALMDITSLNETLLHEDDPVEVGDLIGKNDPGYDLMFESAELRAALMQLEENERETIELRFFENLSQEEIGKRLGMKQTKVSRIQKKGLVKLRLILQQKVDIQKEQKPIGQAETLWRLNAHSGSYYAYF